MSQKIIVQINFLGPFLTPEELAQLETQPLSPVHQWTKENLSSFFDLPFESLKKDVLIRYVEATTPETHMHITPHTDDIFQRMLSPLKAAKKNYSLGEYVATIALSGIVGEMLAILVWKIGGATIKGSPMTEAKEEALFGRSIERLDHSRRLKILAAFEQINEKQLVDFNILKDIRKEFLHFWKPKRMNEKAEALNAFLIALKLFKQITGVELADAGSVKVDPRLLKMFAELNPQPPAV